MPISPLKREEIIDILQRIQSDRTPADTAIYEKQRREFIGILEDEEHPRGTPVAYDDPRGNRTVGVGFNMDTRGARTDWEDAFSKTPKAPDFDKVYAGTPMTHTQIDTLFDYSIGQREGQLQAIYDGLWDKLTPYERLAIESAFYNGGYGIAGRKTNFFKAIKNYVETTTDTLSNTERKTAYLAQAMNELKNHSAGPKNSPDYKGLMIRRAAEAEMFNGTRFDISGLPYLKPAWNNFQKEMLAHAGGVASLASELARTQLSMLADAFHAAGQHLPPLAPPDTGAMRQAFAARYRATLAEHAPRLTLLSPIEAMRQLTQLTGSMEHIFTRELDSVLQPHYGITHYIWSADGGACAACSAHDGEVFDWEDDIGGEHPNCQCQATPVIPERDQKHAPFPLSMRRALHPSYSKHPS